MTSLDAQSNFVFPPPPTLGVPVATSAANFPVRRIFCVGRNYADHAREMGAEVDREAPFYFTKPAEAVALSGTTIAYPPGTQDCHYEGEFVVALGGSAFQVSADEAMGCVFGYAAGIDLTRRDLQGAAKAKGRPWDLGKAFENSALIATIAPVSDFGAIGEQTLTTRVNGEVRQQARLSDMVWSVPELIAHLSRYYHLKPGDLLYTGTPAGVGAVKPDDKLSVKIEGLDELDIAIGEAE
ncbi:fumarylacetoacetate hydrolase family protein [Afifella marina]|uniref:Fumarylpyruvate hydrolase n=1 Tax=Afifella marina DSM 2698 TaxID=1120955 RepID=A0A1G5MV44_AFIMA|nr:fumarylacetoacetate hydrolase family protein [Afifella marina]MBK1621949.1 FAA hydrolase family protein [Afifella marina DSM 2698]MBK1627742.1 FAA hydrolase family protein [Afifella marina]MBK5916709.1 fumarylacetoacetase [Afifella marina]RAI19958.1 fumarylacetoacetase [Afifella marina DSM 2698]SCZ28439.1 fumarylpyruvate hydrolase [Afifella marina DSM 2698]